MEFTIYMSVDLMTGVGSVFQVNGMDGNFVIKDGLEGRTVAYFSVTGYRTDSSTVSPALILSLTYLSCTFDAGDFGSTFHCQNTSIHS